MIWNTSANAVACASGGQCHTGLIVKLGADASSTNPTAVDSFINFLQGNGRRRGQIIGNGATGVTYQTGGADYAEYFAIDESILPQNYTDADRDALFPTGSLVCQGSNGVIPCATNYDQRAIGVISAAPAFQGGEDGPNKVVVGLLGQLPVKISTANGSINKGDPLTASSTTGVAVKATKSGTIIGYALENFTGGSTGQIMAYVNSGFADPTTALSHISVTGGGDLISDTNLAINGQMTATTAQIGNAGQFSVDSLGNTTTSNLIANGSITATGSVSAALLSVASGSISSDQNGNLVNQLAVDINGNNNPTKFAFKNAAGLEVLGLDSNGNATLSGTLTTNVGNYDLAEDYPTNDNSVEAGDIVSADLYNDGYVAKSNGEYDKAVIGIYSEKPGFRLSQVGGKIDGAKAIPVALAGRVPVKVSNENGAVKKGDYLTTSSVAGVAMKATRPGQIIGKALEDFNGTGVGKVLTFVNISFADPTDFFAKLNLDNSNNIVVSKVSSNTVTIPSDISIAGHEVNGSLTNALLAIDNSLTTTNTKIGALETAILGVNDKADALDSRLVTLEDRQASTSSELARTIEDANSLSGRVSSTSADILAINSRLDELLSRISSGSAATSTTVSASPSYIEAINSIASGASLISTGSAEPTNIGVTSAATLSDDITAYTATVHDTFKSFGLSYLGNTTISGDVTVTGQTYLSDTNVVGSFSVGNIALSDNAINTAGTLYLQNSSDSTSLNILNGAVTIDRDGTISAKGNVKVKGDLQLEGAITITATAGEDIKAMDALYVSGKNEVKKADSTNADKAVVIGFAAKNAKKGTTVTVIIGGKAQGFESLKVGKRYYLKNNGGITDVAPLTQSSAIPVGVAFTESELLVQTKQ